MTTENTQYEHQPVMLEEVLDMWFSQSEGFYVDGTFGRGGHSRALLARLDDNGRLAGIDRDPQALPPGRNWQPVIAVFIWWPTVLIACRKWWSRRAGRSTGCCWILGVSSPQLDDAAAGVQLSARWSPWTCAWTRPGRKRGRVVVPCGGKRHCQCAVSLWRRAQVPLDCQTHLRHPVKSSRLPAPCSWPI